MYVCWYVYLWAHIHVCRGQEDVCEFVCIFMSIHMSLYVCRGQHNFSTSSSPFTLCVWGIKLRLPGLAASSFTCWAILPTQTSVFNSKRRLVVFQFRKLDSQGQGVSRAVCLLKTITKLPWESLLASGSSDLCEHIYSLSWCLPEHTSPSVFILPVYRDLSHCGSEGHPNDFNLAWPCE